MSRVGRDARHRADRHDEEQDHSEPTSAARPQDQQREGQIELLFDGERPHDVPVQAAKREFGAVRYPLPVVGEGEKRRNKLAAE